jgi:hypothetical protein
VIGGKKAISGFDLKNKKPSQVLLLYSGGRD